MSEYKGCGIDHYGVFNGCLRCMKGKADYLQSRIDSLEEEKESLYSQNLDLRANLGKANALLDDSGLI